MFIIPKKDLTIVDPQRMDVIPPEGRNVGDDHGGYWNRHLRDEAITIVADDQVAAAQATLEKADLARAEKAAADRAEFEKAAALKNATTKPAPAKAK